MNANWHCVHDPRENQSIDMCNTFEGFAFIKNLEHYMIYPYSVVLYEHAIYTKD